MTLLLNGTNGLSDVDGTASTPAIRGTDTNTGIFFPAADTIAFAEGGAEVARFDSSGNLGIGTSSPSVAAGLGLVLNGASSQARLAFKNTTTGNDSTDGFQVGINAEGEALLDQRENSPLRFTTNATERMRIDSSGNLLVGTTSIIDVNYRLQLLAATGTGVIVTKAIVSTGHVPMAFTNSSNANIGAIVCSNTTTSYITSSDYRLKENIAPMTGALGVVQQLKPVTYNWKVDGSSGQGFIAHELQEVVPDCVTGEKDAVETYTDEDGVEQTRPRYQGIDTSFLVATLTKAIQELKAEVDAQALEIQALKGVA